jgi:hypothetical protein
MPAAYQDENGKWWKECSTTKELFGPVDNREALSEWFHISNQELDGFKTSCKSQRSLERKLHYESYKNTASIKSKLWRENNKETAGYIYTSKKSSAKKRGINFTLTLEWFEEQLKLPEYNICAISKIKFVDGERNPFSRSLDRISSTKGYTPDNVRWVCFKYNSWKSDLTLHEVSLIFKYMSESYGYDPIEYLRQTIQQVS